MHIPTVEVPCEAKAPMALEVTLTQDPKDPNPPDYTLVQSARFEVRDEAGNVRNWIPDLSNASAQQVVATYTFAANGTDVPEPIRLLVMPWIQQLNDSGERRCSAFHLIARFDI